ncbi:topoisomerase DNA-binding C4 zinc finger domain-containing protein [Bacteroides finegoldii]|uniref:topoisomerase DNA-binding C4 zinc finger domain-containing protein n=1 Tax=Bacteroides finegoldii TaxID=338188 RepID=UPI001EE66B78|nr:topoisomerase DNA-binding C4 zinc finger domain-containing protein [Bacteroides finegoldii]
MHTDNNIVVNRYNLKRAILQYRTAVLNQETINWIIQTINQNRIIADKEKLKQHKHNAKARQYRSSRLINQDVCPQCGRHLILRKGKYGTFHGCSNFPTYKFTINS